MSDEPDRCPTCWDKGYISESVPLNQHCNLNLWQPCPRRCPASERWLERGGS